MNGTATIGWKQLRESLRANRVELLIGRLCEKPRRTPAEEALLERLVARHPAGQSSQADLRPDQVRIGRPAPAEWVGLEWFVAQVRRGRETEARDYLELAQAPVMMIEERIETRARTGENRNGERTERDVPLWPGYLFVARPTLDVVAMTIDNDERAGLAPLFTGFLGGQDGQLWRVNGAKMAELFIANEAMLFTPELRKAKLRERFALGQEVRIVDGPFASFFGVLHSFANGESAEIWLDLFGRTTPVTLRLDNLE